MDPRILKYYEQELQYLREMGREFAAEFPKIAGRLGMDDLAVADPYVERLLEGVAFLTARIQLRQNAEFSRFTQHLLEMVYPHYLAPTPSMVIARFQPDLNEGELSQGFVLPRGTALTSVQGKGDQTGCEFRTAQPVTLWPLELEKAEYFTRDAPQMNLPAIPGVKAGVRLRLRTTAGLTFDKLALDSLSLYLPGQDQRRFRLYELLLGTAVAIVVRPADLEAGPPKVLGHTSIRPLGFDSCQALLPTLHRSFEGYRLLDEYFAFPDRFLFVELTGLSETVRQCRGNQLDLIVLFSRHDQTLEGVVTKENFALSCTPAINLFPRRADRIHLSEATEEYQVIPDRTRPLDFEVYSITRVAGLGSSSDEEQQFFPFYAQNDLTRIDEHKTFYTTNRVPRLLSSRQQQQGPRSGYIGSEVFLTLVDGLEGPCRQSFRQLSVETLCTNRDLALQMPIGRANTDFSLQISAPVQSVRILCGPTRPRTSPIHNSGELSWRLINQLSLNYLSLIDNNQKQGAAALRELLAVYIAAVDPAALRQIEAVHSVASRPIVRRIPAAGPIMYGRGVEISLTLDEGGFEGSGAFLLGSVLEEFFARYVSINSFTETVLHSLTRGEIARWPLRTGRRHSL